MTGAPRPPEPPRSGALASAEQIELGGRDAFLAVSSAPHAPGVVVLGDRSAYEDALAERFADAGIHALSVAEAVEPATAELRRLGAGAVYVVGVGAHGAAALLEGTQPGVAGVVGVGADPSGAALDAARAGSLTAPVLTLYGDDGSVTDETVEAFHAALAHAGTLHETVVYDGAPQAFFDGARDDLAEACDDAWRRILRFAGVPAIR